MTGNPEKTKICILVLFGLPGSGKTTLTEKLQRLSNKTDVQCLQEWLKYYVCYDKILTTDLEADVIRKGLEESEGTSEWKKYRRDIVTNVDYLINSIVQGQPYCAIPDSAIANDTMMENPNINIQQRFASCVEKSNQVNDTHAQFTKILIVIDDNMYYRSMRYEYYQLARKYQISFAEVFINCEIETALERNRTRTHPVPENVIVTMATKIEPPSSSESWEKYHIVINSEQQATEVDYNRWTDHVIVQISKLTEESLLDPCLPVLEVDSDQVEESRVVCSTNVVHQSDLILRKLIAQHMANHSTTGSVSQSKQTIAKELNTRKSRILSEMKTGKLLIPAECEISVTDASKNPGSSLYIFLEMLFNNTEG